MYSLYTLFGVVDSSHPSDIGLKYHERVLRLTPQAVEEDFRRRGWGSPPPALITAMRAYLYSSACLLSNPSSNEIYNAWLHRQPGVGERMRWFNKHATTPVFAETCFEGCTPSRIIPTPPSQARESTVCRWCVTPFDMPSSALYKCKCGGWAGHRACGEAFAREYNQKCPICRTKLLPRTKLSKYMFWSVDAKWKF